MGRSGLIQTMNNSVQPLDVSASFNSSLLIADARIAFTTSS